MDNCIDSIAALRVFVRVAERGSFRAAAASLDMAASTVSAQIQRLEEQLGTVLLHRTTRCVRLTNAGQRFLERSYAVFDALHTAEAAVGPEPGEARGRLVVSAPLSLSREILAPRLPRFLKENPGVNIKLHVQNQPVDLIADGIDARIHVGLPPTGEVRGMKIGVSRGGLTASTDYARRYGLPEQPEDLVDHQLISFVHDRLVNWELTSGNQRRVVRHPTRLSCSVIGVTFEAIRNGVGIGWLPDTIRQPGIDKGKLVPVLADWNLTIDMDVWLVYLEQKQHSSALAAFIDFLQEETEALRRTLGDAEEPEPSVVD